MRYDILKDYCPDRRGTGSAKWDMMAQKFGDPDLIPLWVADMDFRTPEVITDALKQYVDFGIFGYEGPVAGYIDAIIDWTREQHQYILSKDWIRYAPGVVTGYCECIESMTRPADAIIILTPVYTPFFKCILGSGRQLVCQELTENNGCYGIDFQAFEQKIIAHAVKALLFCSPHNPVGRVWTRDELLALLAVCERHDVLIISDEIHRDILMPGFKHIPIASLGETANHCVVTISSASKTFNLAGLGNAHVIIPNPRLRAAFDAYVNVLHLSYGTRIGYIATKQAYKFGRPWLDDVLTVIRDNYRLLADQLEKSLPLAVISPLQGTYLAWIDLGAYVRPPYLKAVVQEQARLAVNYGKEYWPDQPEDTHVRINLGTHRRHIRQAAENLATAVRACADAHPGLARPLQQRS